MYAQKASLNDPVKNVIGPSLWAIISFLLQETTWAFK